MTTVSELRIGGYHPNSFIDYPGKVAAVVFFQGCNFRCPFCHNGQLIPRNRAGSHPPREILARLRERVGQLAGVVLSGGEPTLQPALPDFCSALKRLGYAVKLDTNGSNPDLLDLLLTNNLLDYVAMDIKAPFERYSELAGTEVDRCALQRSLQLLASSGIGHHFRTTFDQSRLTETDLQRIRELVPHGSKYVIQPCR
nr:anaerobic ribonucleoside-triphosphate reductase activating protein [uncultured Desulfobulbus sp.]